MTQVVQNNNVVEVTNQPGFQENLETLQRRLSVCEKALAEYLETKRISFPRFYFVSASDLLEIVSKGTQPKQVTRRQNLWCLPYMEMNVYPMGGFCFVCFTGDQTLAETV